MIMEIPQHIKQKMSDDIRRAGFQETDYNRLLSIGRIYHTLSLVIEENRSQDTVVIFVMQYRPQYLSQSKSVTYKYRFQCPDSLQYDSASHKLALESLETFPWNTIDNVVGYHGTGDHKLADIAKYWHIRLILIPVSQDYMVKNIDTGVTKCDSRPEMSHADYFGFVEHFVRFLIMLNKLTRTSQSQNDCIHRVNSIVLSLEFLFSVFFIHLATRSSYRQKTNGSIQSTRKKSVRKKNENSFLFLYFISSIVFQQKLFD